MRMNQRDEIYVSIAVQTVCQSRGSREGCPQKRRKARLFNCTDTDISRTAEPIEAKCCTLFRLKLFTVIFIYSAGKYGGRSPFNCPHRP